MNVHTTRLVMFTIWLVIALFYIVAFLLTGLRSDIAKREAWEAAWTVGYILGPILAGFAQFYLGPGADNRLRKEKNRIVHPHQLWVMGLLTIACHLVLILYFCVFAWCATFKFSADEGDNFNSAVSFGFKLMLVLGTLPIFGVNYILNREDIALGQPQPK